MAGTDTGLVLYLMSAKGALLLSVKICAYACRIILANHAIVALPQGIQDLLDNPNPSSPAQAEAYQLFV